MSLLCLILFCVVCVVTVTARSLLKLMLVSCLIFIGLSSSVPWYLSFFLLILFFRISICFAYHRHRRFLTVRFVLSYALVLSSFRLSCLRTSSIALPLVFLVLFFLVHLRSRVFYCLHSFLLTFAPLLSIRLLLYRLPFFGAGFRFRA